MMRLLIIALISFFAVLSNVRAADTIYKFSSGDWNGAAYKTSGTNSFSHCSIVATYKSGISLAFGISPGFALSLVLGKSSWKLGRKEKYQIGLKIDGEYLGNYSAIGKNDKYLLVEFGNNRSLFNKLRFGRRLSVVSPSETFSFKLTGTARALLKVKNCVETAVALSGSGKKRQSFSNNKTNPFSGSSRKKTRNLKPALRTILRASGANEIKFFDPSAAWKLTGETYGWIVNGIVGLAFDSKLNSRPSNTVLSSVLTEFGEDCKGQYVTSIKQSSFSGKFEFRDGLGLCSGATEKSAVHLTAVLDGKQDEVVFFVHIGNNEKAFLTAEFADKFKSSLVSMMDSNDP